MVYKKLTVGEIKKALEHCAGLHCLCSDCILFEPEDDDCQCSSNLKLNALDLINRQKAENENFRMVLDAVEDHIHPLPFETDFDKAINKAKAEAYKECIEKVKEEILFYSNMTEVYDFLDNLYKELVGDDK